MHEFAMRPSEFCWPSVLLSPPYLLNFITLHFADPMATALASSAVPDLNNVYDPDLEPDLSWKNATRRQIEAELQSIVDMARQDRDTRLHVETTESGQREIVQEYMAKMADVRRQANAQYLNALEHERRKRRSLSVVPEDGDWTKEVLEQQKLLDYLRRAAASRAGGPSRSTAADVRNNNVGADASSLSVADTEPDGYRPIHDPSRKVYVERQGVAPRISRISNTSGSRGTGAKIFAGSSTRQETGSSMKAGAVPEFWRPANYSSDRTVTLETLMQTGTPGKGTPKQASQDSFMEITSQSENNGSKVSLGDEMGLESQLQELVESDIIRSQKIPLRALREEPRTLTGPSHVPSPALGLSGDVRHRQANRAVGNRIASGADASGQVMQATSSTSARMPIVDPRSFAFEDGHWRPQSNLGPRGNPGPQSHSRSLSSERDRSPQVLSRESSGRPTSNTAVEGRQFTSDDLSVIASDDDESEWEASGFDMDDLERMMKDEMKQFTEGAPTEDVSAARHKAEVILQAAIQKEESSQRAMEEVSRKEDEIRKQEESRRQQTLKRKEQDFGDYKRTESQQMTNTSDENNVEAMQEFRRQQEELWRRDEGRRRQSDTTGSSNRMEWTQNESHREGLGAGSVGIQARRDNKAKRGDVRKREERRNEKGSAKMENFNRRHEESMRNEPDVKGKGKSAVKAQLETEVKGKEALRRREEELQQKSEDLMRKEEELQRREDFLNRRAEEVLAKMKAQHDEFRKEWIRTGGRFS
ncbi:hypothetical protein AcW1_003285 [Taiwanofungus camphoratus]|nr:hypothetical protein AcW1_003285 [Antrodia cinnamomea]